MSFGLPIRNGLSIGLWPLASLSQGFGYFVPALTLNFLSGAPLDSRITFTRGSTATYVDSNGLYQTAAIDEPRFDYDPTTLAPRGLLLEGARTNSAVYSNDFTQTAWVATGITPTFTANDPNGTANSASTLTATSNDGTILQTIISASAARATSCFVKRRTGTGAVQMTQNGGTTWTTVTVSANWTRVFIPTATITNPVVGFRMATSGDQIDVCWFQCENGSFATSIIPTGATAVVRSADSAIMTGTDFSDWYNPVGGTFLLCASTQKPLGVSTTANAISANNNTTAEVISLRFGTNTATSIVTDNSSVQAQLGSGAYLQNVATTTALAYRQNDFAFCQDNGVVLTDNVGTLPTVTQMNVGARNGNLDSLNGHICTITYYATRLSNQQLQRITA